MIVVTIAIAAGTMLVMAVIMSYVLGWANKKFHVEVDPRVEAVIDALPGANCGGCGYLGCSDYAVAIVMDNVPVHKCPVGGEACAAVIANIMGIEVGEALVYRPVVLCGAKCDDRKGKTTYQGEKRCAAATLVAGVQGCTFGCLGFGDCVQACNYDAIHVNDGLAVVDYDACVGCGACARACPRNIITIVKFTEKEVPVAACSNRDKGKNVSVVCDKGCIGCKACTRKSNIFSMDGTLTVTDYEHYSQDRIDDVRQAIEKCPNGCISYVGKKS